MSESTTIRYVGLDVHRDSIAIAVASSDGKPAESLGTVPNDIPGLIKRLLRLGPAASLRCCYEAGPTGFGLARRLKEAGIACEVIAPSLVPVQPGRGSRPTAATPRSSPSISAPATSRRST